MKIYLPWRIKGFDGKKHIAFISIEYGQTQTLETLMRARLKKQITEELEEKYKKKKTKKGGLRKCKGHKPPKLPQYSNDGQCSICGGYIKK